MESAPGADTLSDSYTSSLSASSPPKPGITESQDLENTQGVTENLFEEFIKGMIEAYMAFGLYDKIKAEELNQFASKETKKITDQRLKEIYGNIQKEHPSFGNAEAAAASGTTRAAAGRGGGKRSSIKRKHRSIPTIL
jgi:hypothetical protein